VAIPAPFTQTAHPVHAQKPYLQPSSLLPSGSLPHVKPGKCDGNIFHSSFCPNEDTGQVKYTLNSLWSEARSSQVWQPVSQQAKELVQAYIGERLDASEVDMWMPTKTRIVHVCSQFGCGNVQWIDAGEIVDPPMFFGGEDLYDPTLCDALAIRINNQWFCQKLRPL
jgi:hypothetical protein